MKKQFYLIICSIFMLGALSAQKPNLVVSGGTRQFQENNGTYTPQGTYNGKTYWLGPGNQFDYVIGWNKYMNRWVVEMMDRFNDVEDALERGNGEINLNSIPLDIPEGTFKYYGNYAFDVEVAGSKLEYSADVLTESDQNDGSFSDSITIQHNKFDDIHFAGSDGDDFLTNKYARIDNLPAGLKASLIRRSDSTLVLSLNEKANNHSVDSNFTITFYDAAYANGGKADSTKNNAFTVTLNFINVIKVAKSGGDFDKIQNAVDAAGDGDIIEIGEGVFTEMVSSSSLFQITIKGMGPDKTIVQADTAPKIASGRVIDFAAYYSGDNQYTLEGLTIRHGYVTKTTQAGGIKASGHLSMKNCRVIDNHIKTNNCIGGGIYATSLELINSEVSNNSAEGNTNNNAYGGGIGVFGSTYIENVTISGNSSSQWGGGIYQQSQEGNGTIINSTISNNTTKEMAGGIWAVSKFDIKNSIIYGNSADVGADLNQRFVFNAITLDHTFINKVSSGIYANNLYTDTANFMGSPLSADPLLDTLAFNCGVTRTHALKQGSPAIDSAVVDANTPSYDQRGFKAFNTKDIGAHEVVELSLNISKDSICAGSSELIALGGPSHKFGILSGNGVTNDTFSAANISNEGFVKITYTSGGCEVVDSILVKESVQLSFMMSKDSICLGSDENIDLKGSHGFASFTGEGVTGNTFSAADIQNEGYVRITYAAGPNDCAEEAVDSIYVYKCVNSIENQQLLNVTLYPNPANDRLWIKTATAQNAAVTILDVAGNVVLQTELNNPQEGINIADLPEGMYVVRTSIGGMRNIQKFVKL